RKNAGRLRSLYGLEELDVMSHYSFQGRRAVVVEIWGGLSDPMESRDIEFIPVIERRRAADKARQQGPSRIRTRAPDFGAVGERELIGAYLTGDAVGAGLENKPWRRDRVHGLGTANVDVGEPRDDGRLGGRTPGTAMAYRAGPQEYCL